MSRSGTFFGKGIRAFTRNPFRREPKSEVNHAGIVSATGIESALIVEALVRPGVVEHSFYEKYAGKDVCVARALNISDDDRLLLAGYAKEFIGREYTESALVWQALGMAKLLAPLLGDKWIFCSWVAAAVYEKIGLNFGIDHRRADPDDLYDFVVANLGTIYFWIIPPTWMDRSHWEPGTILLPSQKQT